MVKAKDKTLIYELQAAEDFIVKSIVSGVCHFDLSSAQNLYLNIYKLTSRINIIINFVTQVTFCGSDQLVMVLVGSWHSKDL